MSRQGAGLLGLSLLLVTAALVFVLGRTTRPLEPARSGNEKTASPAERPRRPRTTRPRPAARETREASVTTGLPPTLPPSAPRAASPASAPQGSGRATQLATTVLKLAVSEDWMVTDEHDTPCPPEKVRIVYDAPSDLGAYDRGAYFEPLGPGPDDRAVEVNGLLLCEGSTFLYRGFEAFYRADRGQWDVFPFPVIE